MGSQYREPRPKSPERLRLVSIDSVRFDDENYDSVVVKATFTYDKWCCNGMHEIADAVSALDRTVQSGKDKAEKKRLKGLQKEHEELLKEFGEQS